MTINHDDIECIYEDPSIYDGWSVAEMKDGSFVNRWPEDDRRHAPAEVYRLAIIADREATA